ncbi:hypothetical protein AAVH_12046 [Aphelenchoides avenae]|nr:hypothetical protein AAVH_33745 [Aphelenchus avenae]KAH7720513.1 hypothetical protein AAVH_12046 [Aphelenchus avenae]
MLDEIVAEIFAFLGGFDLDAAQITCNQFRDLLRNRDNKFPLRTVSGCLDEVNSGDTSVWNLRFTSLNVLPLRVLNPTFHIDALNELFAFLRKASRNAVLHDFEFSDSVAGHNIEGFRSAVQGLCIVHRMIVHSHPPLIPGTGENLGGEALIEPFSRIAGIHVIRQYYSENPFTFMRPFFEECARKKVSDLLFGGDIAVPRTAVVNFCFDARPQPRRGYRKVEFRGCNIPDVVFTSFVNDLIEKHEHCTVAVGPFKLKIPYCTWEWHRGPFQRYDKVFNGYRMTMNVNAGDLEVYRAENDSFQNVFNDVVHL